MKFILTSALLIIELLVLVSAQDPCLACEQVLSLQKCSSGWADNVNFCINSSCTKKPSDSELDLNQCTGPISDQNPITGDASSHPTAHTNSTTTRGPSETKPTKSMSTHNSTVSGGAAAPAFGGIGFGGGAAAMVGLAGLVGLAL